MKIAVTATGKTLDSPLDQRFGRAARFIVWDSESATYEVLDNTQNLNANQGAGIQTAGNVVRSGAHVLISGHLGPKAFQVLNAAGIEMYCADVATVNDALEAYAAKRLEAIVAPTVEGHWI